jgi:hypothetical protein
MKITVLVVVALSTLSYRWAQTKILWTSTIGTFRS